jgi:hypothetical protein
MQDLINNSNMPPAITMACCALPVCPAGTKLAGRPLPADGVCDCLCAAGTDKAGQNVASCNNPVGPVCPSDSDNPGKKSAPCNNSPKADVALVCAAGTDKAGQNVASCNNPVPPSCPVDCPAGFQQGTYNGNYQPFAWGGLGAGAGGPVNYTGCLPICEGDDTLMALSGGQFGPGLGDAWTDEGVANTRTTAVDGTEVFIACQNIVQTRDCLRSDSLVMLSNGATKPISAIKIGDKLKGPEGDVSVVAVNRMDGAAMYYRINDFKFAITGDHPIQTTKGLKAADDSKKYKDVVVGRLEVGDIVVTSAGEVEVKTITLEKTKKGTHSVNIKTEGDRSFFVDGVAIKPFKDMSFTY